MSGKLTLHYYLYNYCPSWAEHTCARSERENKEFSFLRYRRWLNKEGNSGIKVDSSEIPDSEVSKIKKKSILFLIGISCLA